MATYYVSQSGAGAKDGSKAAPFAIGDQGTAWTWTGANTYYILGTLTTAIDISGKNDLELRGDDADYPGVINGISGDPIYVHGGSARSIIRNITVTNASGNGRVYVIGGSNHLIDGVVCNVASIRVGVSGSTANGSVIKNCTVRNWTSTAIYMAYCTNGLISNCTVEDCGTAGGVNNHDGIAVDDTCGGTRVENCRVYRQRSAQGSGIDIQDGVAGAITVSGCEVHDSETHGFSSVGATGDTGSTNTFMGCIATGCGQGGFYPHSDGGHIASFYNCIATGNGSGFKIGSSSYTNSVVTIKNCVVADNDNEGFYIQNSGGSITEQYNCVHETTVYAATGDAITLDATDTTVDPHLSSDYYAGNTELEEAGVWVAGVRLHDDLPLPLSPPIGAKCRRDWPGRRFGAGGGAL